MSSEAIFLDVNVPMYAAGQPHIYREACAWVMGEVAAGHLGGCYRHRDYSGDFLYRYGALRRFDLAVALASEVLNLVPTVLPITRDDALKSVDLFKRFGTSGVTARDVLHTAVMHNHHLQQIITTDAHFESIPGLIRIDPLSMFTQSRAG